MGAECSGAGKKKKKEEEGSRSIKSTSNPRQTGFIWTWLVRLLLARHGRIVAYNAEQTWTTSASRLRRWTRYRNSGGEGEFTEDVAALQTVRI